MKPILRVLLVLAAGAANVHADTSYNCPATITVQSEHKLTSSAPAIFELYPSEPSTKELTLVEFRGNALICGYGTIKPMTYMSARLPPTCKAASGEGWNDPIRVVGGSSRSCNFAGGGRRNKCTVECK